MIQQGELAHGTAPADLPGQASFHVDLHLSRFDDVHGITGLSFLHQPLPRATRRLLHRVDQGVHLAEFEGILASKE